MKKTNKKLLTLMLAGVLCTTAGTVAATLPMNASAATDPAKYELTKIFNSNGTSAAIGAEDTDDGRVAAFTIGNGESVEFNRNLAIQWYEGPGAAKYMSLEFTFADLKFTEMDFIFDATALNATKDDIATNTVKFVKNAETNVVSFKVLNGDAKSADVTGVETAIAANSKIALTLAEGSQLGSYAVKLTVGGVEVANSFEFTNIGEKYFNNGTVNGKELQSLVIKATTANGDRAPLYLTNINGQKFNNLTEDDKVTDTAAPVLVVNEDVTSFLLGTQFELNYKEIDVLDDSLTSTKTFYQYNPTDTEISYKDKDENDKPIEIDYADTLTPNSSTGTYFQETNVYWDGTETGWTADNFSKEAKEGFTQTTFFRALEEEYVSIRFTLQDDSFKDNDGTAKKHYYDLAWYAKETKTLTVGSTTADYIIFNRSENGPQYKENYTPDDVAAYEKKLQAEANDAFAGSNSDVELPSLAWLISDDDGYSTLQYTISYKTPDSNSASTTSNVKSNALKISVSDAGWYEFKVFATDDAGNAMYVDKLDKDGNLVKDDNGDVIREKVTTSNIWDLENVPSFRFQVKTKGIEIDEQEDDDTTTSKIIGETYTLSSIDVIGANSESSTNVLYKLDISKYTGAGNLTVETLSKIEYSKLQTKVLALRAEAVKAGKAYDYQDLNKQAYIELVASAVGGTVEEVAKIFVLEIDEFNSDIKEGTEAWDNSHNKYNWNATAGSFTAAESGLFMIMADYWDSEFIEDDHAPAYQLIEVESEADVIKGETEWLKNNLVSVILFSVAAVMLILIIILLLVKPSDETLEDVDKKVVSKRKEATDKHKKK